MNPPANAGVIRDVGLIPASGRCPEGGHGNPLQYSCLENPMDRGAWWVMVHSITVRHNWSDLACMHIKALFMSYFCRVVVLVAQSSWLFATPWTVECQAPLSMGCSRQEYWSGLPFSSPEGLPDLGTEPEFPALQADSLPSELQGRSILYTYLAKCTLFNEITLNLGFSKVYACCWHYFKGIFHLFL